MKRFISTIIAVTMIFFSCSTFSNAYSTDKYQSEIIDEKIIEEVTGLYDYNNLTTEKSSSTSLFKTKTLTLSKTETRLLITAKTTGIEEVTKSGFTYIKLQRLINGTWTDYTSYCYYDQYSNSNSKTFSKSVSAPKGYTYRVICEHYVEKPRLIIFKTTEKSYNVTSSLSY